MITISNSGPRNGAEGSSNANSRSSCANGKVRGIGLRNTGERLKALYGDDHRFLLEWPDAGGCEAMIEVPLRRAVQAVEGGVCAH